MNIPSTDSPTSRSTALRLLGAGLWPVVISPPDDPRWKNPGKSPIGNAWGASRHSEESLARMYDLHPRAGVGILLGPLGRIIDVECDGPGAEDSLMRLLDGRAILTAGWTSRRGRHRLFRYDLRLSDVGRSIVKLPGLEIRIGHGVKQFQSVCPPTADRAWTGFGDIAPLPGASVSLLRKLTKVAKAHPTPYQEACQVGGVTRVIAYLATCDPSISGQRGHDTCFRVAVKIGPGFNLDPESAFELLWVHYNPRCEPPWSEYELRHKVRDAYSTEPRRGWMIN